MVSGMRPEIMEVGLADILEQTGRSVAVDIVDAVVRWIEGKNEGRRYGAGGGELGKRRGHGHEGRDEPARIIGERAAARGSTVEAGQFRVGVGTGHYYLTKARRCAGNWSA